MAPERIELRPRKLRHLALLLCGSGMAFGGAIFMMQNPDTRDQVLAVVSGLLGIGSLVVIPDLFRPWSYHGTCTQELQVRPAPH
jgi:hypothetical protein